MEEIVTELFELYGLGMITGIGLMMIFGCLSSVIGYLAAKMKGF